MIPIILTLFLVLYFLNSHYKYWEKRGVPGPRPTFLIENLLENFLVKKSPAEFYSEIYKQYKNASVVGIFKAVTPTLIIRSPDFIQEITIKQFKHFRDNELMIDKKVDPLLGRNPFFLRGQDWKLTRVQLAPGLTTGKMKVYYPLLEEVCESFIKYLERHPTATTGGGCLIKEACMRFTLNNIGRCAFGIEAKCFDEENPELKKIAEGFLSSRGFQNLKIYIVSLIPFLFKLCSIKFTPLEVQNKLVSIINQALQYRQENNVSRNDFLNVLEKSNLTELELTAHATTFFGDGFETSSIVFHFVLYELAANPQTQKELREEINEVFDKNDTLSYEELHKMKYLDAVFKETLRLQPTSGSLNKICTESFTFVPKEGDSVKQPFVIEKGTPCTIPLYALHRDPEYFEDPDSFKPERFFQEVKKFTFMPFGGGPRTCLGQRFGTLQVKIGVVYVIKHFEVSLNEKTKPVQYDPLYFLTLPRDPVYLDFKKIN